MQKLKLLNSIKTAFTKASPINYFETFVDHPISKNDYFYSSNNFFSHHSHEMGKMLILCKILALPQLAHLRLELGVFEGDEL